MKKLLILAGSPNEIDLVKRAKERGIYTIVTDMYDTHRSPAKLLADEYWNDSWSDIEVLIKRCKLKGVDGVIGGYSEFVVENVIKLTQKLGLPCYCSMEQLDVTRNKSKFKKICRANNVPVAHEYESIENVNSYPVIVKPTDRGGSIGISIANNYIELKAAYNYAMEKSVEKKVIIEDFICNGVKVDVYYAVVNKEIYYLTSNDTVNAEDNGHYRTVQSAWTLKSKYENDYLKKEDRKVRKLIRSLGIENGFLLFSVFAIPDKDGNAEFAFFECGFRLTGDHANHYVKKQCGVDYQDIFINSALGIKEELLFGNRNSNLKCAIINYYARKGVIGEISGIDKIALLPECEFALKIARRGIECFDDKAILQKVAMFQFVGTSISNIRNSVKRCNELLICRDIEGRDMVYDRVDPKKLFE